MAILQINVYLIKIKSKIGTIIECDCWRMIVFVLIEEFILCTGA